MHAKGIIKHFFSLLGGYSLLHYLSKWNIKVLSYHRFVPDDDPAPVSSKYVKQTTFNKQIGFLKKYFNILPLEYIIAQLHTKSCLPKNWLAITIDDGYFDFFQYAFPVLNKNNLPATVYLVSDFVKNKKWLWQDKIKFCLRTTSKSIIANDKYFGNLDLTTAPSLIKSQLKIYNLLLKSPPDIRNRQLDYLSHIFDVDIPPLPPFKFSSLDVDHISQMADRNIHFGSHTISHEALTSTSLNHAQQEIAESKKDLEQFLSMPMETFCFPHDRANQDLIRIVKKSGYIGAVNGIGVNHRNMDPFQIRRLFINECNLFDFRHKMYRP